MATLTITRTYQYLFHTHPNCTLALTGGILNALGDVIAQTSQNVVRSYVSVSILLSLCLTFPRSLAMISIDPVGMLPGLCASSVLALA